MLTLYTKKDGTRIGTFQNYQELCRHIMHQENLMLFEDHPDFGQSRWSFSLLLPDRIPEIIKLVKKNHDVETLRVAWRQHLSVVVMCEGDIQNMRYILVTPNINVDALLEDWCIDYCHAHGITIT